jgi:eukaryotic-like serine/threonine-protein kinase
MLSRGARIHGYEVWGKLGEGGMGEVWLAKHDVLCIPVVIKIMRKSVAEAVGSAGSRRMFDEARLMARVTSPRVVRAVDAGTLDGTPYLVQEYVDGLDMAELDGERRSSLGVGLPLWTVCHVMEEACRALHSAHQAGVIHRDMKPSNLFAAPASGVRLGDFGIAVARDEGMPTEVSGTLKFMAPEQLRGEPAHRTTDAYGAAATACDLRYGRGPFATVGDILDETKEPSFPPPGDPAEAYFQQVLRGMLSKHRGDRPQDLSEPAAHFATLYHALHPAREAEAFAVLAKNRFRFQGCEITFSAGDIADEKTAGIVTSARYDLTMRSGVGDALRRRGGDAIEQEATKNGERALGECCATGAGSLAARWVLHAVSAWDETSCVGRATLRALATADHLGVTSLAFPALGTGAARVSLETCANAMATALRWRLAMGASRLTHVSFVLGDERKLEVFRDVAIEALRGNDTLSAPIDVGLPDKSPVVADAATCFDAAGGTTRA